MHGSTSRHLLLALALATLVAQGGCAWLRFWQEPPPQVLPPGAGLEQVIAAVNQNNSQIQALFSNSATLSGPGYPTLRAHIAFQRQRNFRLQGRTGLDRAGGRPGQQRSILLVLDQAQPAAGGLLLPPRSVPHEPGAADDPHRSQLADRGPRHARARPAAAAPGSLSVDKAIGFKSAPSWKRPKDRT